MRPRTSRGRSTPTWVAISPVPRTGRTAVIRCQIRTTLAHTFSRLGIASGMQVVAYDQENGMYASRLWWLLRWLGHDAVAVLDGGFAKWTAEGRPHRSGVETHSPRATSQDRRARIWRSTWRSVASLVGTCRRGSWSTRARPSAIAATPSRSTGSPGTFPARRTTSFSGTSTREGSSERPRSCAPASRESLGDVSADRLVCYCGSGVTACHNLLALEHAGLTGAKLYAGSWSEWSADPSRPVERG